MAIASTRETAVADQVLTRYMRTFLCRTSRFFGPVDSKDACITLMRSAPSPWPPWAACPSPTRGEGVRRERVFGAHVYLQIVQRYANPSPLVGEGQARSARERRRPANPT